jgi:branched-chain amino acid transport system substrate-binding protein
VSSRSLIVGGAVAALAIGVCACGGKKEASVGPVISGSTLTIYSSLPLQGAAGPQAEAIANAAKLALSDAGGKVGDYKIRYLSLDDSTAAAGKAVAAAVAANAGRAVGDPRTIGYIGEFNSGATKVSLPILNRASIAQVSPSNTYVGLTTNRAGSQPGEPDRYYPSGKRTFVRVVPADDVQGAALITAAADAKCKSIEIWNSGTAYGAGLARNVEIAASKIVTRRPGPAGTRLAGATHAVKVVGNVRIDPKASSYQALAAKITAGCFIFTGEIESNAPQVFKDVLAAHPGMKLFGTDGAVSNALASPTTGLPANVAARFEGTFPAVAPAKLGSAAAKFTAQFEQAFNTTNPDPYAVYGYESMALLLNAIKRSEDAHDGKVTRADVASALIHTKDRSSVLGTYSIDSAGDTTLTDYGLYRIADGKLVFGRLIKAPRLS